jgi:flagellar biosynthesis chaperone FliJ
MDVVVDETSKKNDETMDVENNIFVNNFNKMESTAKNIEINVETQNRNDIFSDNKIMETNIIINNNAQLKYSSNYLNEPFFKKTLFKHNDNLALFMFIHSDEKSDIIEKISAIVESQETLKNKIDRILLLPIFSIAKKFFSRNENYFTTEADGLCALRLIYQLFLKVSTQKEFQNKFGHSFLQKFKLLDPNLLQAVKRKQFLEFLRTIIHRLEIEIKDKFNKHQVGMESAIEKLKQISAIISNKKFTKNMFVSLTDLWITDEEFNVVTPPSISFNMFASYKYCNQTFDFSDILNDEWGILAETVVNGLHRFCNGNKYLNFEEVKQIIKINENCYNDLYDNADSLQYKDNFQGHFFTMDTFSTDSIYEVDTLCAHIIYTLFDYKISYREILNCFHGIGREEDQNTLAEDEGLIKIFDNIVDKESQSLLIDKFYKLSTKLEEVSYKDKERKRLNWLKQIEKSKAIHEENLRLKAENDQLRELIKKNNFTI